MQAMGLPQTNYRICLRGFIGGVPHVAKARDWDLRLCKR